MHIGALTWQAIDASQIGPRYGVEANSGEPQDPGSGDGAESRTPPPPAWLRKAKVLIQDRSFTSITIAMIAKEVGIHPVHLASEFRRFYGITIGTFVRTRRLELAASLLRFSEEPIAKIAIDCGFCDQAHLTKSFKQHYKVTPAQYRAPRPSA